MRARAQDCCEYRHVPSWFDPLPLHGEHVISKKHHGRSVLSNLALGCPACNLFNAANIAGVDVESGELTRVFHPRTDPWGGHFDWDGAVLVGKTAVGRTTIDVLQINQPERIRHRELRIQLGDFPPQMTD